MPIMFFSEAYFFQAWGSLTLIFQTRDTQQSSSRRTRAQDFYVLKKSIDLSRIWTLDLEASTLPHTTAAENKVYSSKWSRIGKVFVIIISLLYFCFLAISNRYNNAITYQPSGLRKYEQCKQNAKTEHTVLGLLFIGPTPTHVLFRP